MHKAAMDEINLVGSQRRATENSAGRYLYQFFLAAVANAYENTAKPDTFPFSEEDGFDVFAYHTGEAEAPKKIKRPVTIRREAKTLLGALFASIVSVVNESGKVPAGGGIKGHLANARAARSDQVVFMIAAAEGLWDKIHAGCLARDFDSVECFRAKLEALVGNRAHIDPGADELARIYVRFLKCVAWVAATFAVETKVTLNEKFLRAVVRTFSMFPDAGDAEDMAEFFDNQLAWVAEHDTVNKKKKGGKAAAKPAAAAAAPADAAPADDAPAGDAPAGDAPADDAPAGDAPAGDAADDAPADPDPEPAARPGEFSYDDLIGEIADL